MFHKDVLAGDGHIIHQWAVADSAALTALVLVSSDIGKVSFQQDTKKFRVLEDLAPTWRILNAPLLSTTDDLAEGATKKYFNQPGVLSTPMTGITTAVVADVVATSTLLEAIGFLQNATTALAASVLSLASSASTVLIGIVNKFTKAQTVAPITLTWAATITLSAEASNNFRVTLGGNTTLANPSDLSALVDGAIFNIKIKQDATGSRTLTLGNKFKVPGGTALVLTTAANSTDLLVAQYWQSEDIFITNIMKDIK